MRSPDAWVPDGPTRAEVDRLFTRLQAAVAGHGNARPATSGAQKLIDL